MQHQFDHVSSTLKLNRYIMGYADLANKTAPRQYKRRQLFVQLRGACGDVKVGLCLNVRVRDSSFAVWNR